MFWHLLRLFSKNRRKTHTPKLTFYYDFFLLFFGGCLILLVSFSYLLDWIIRCVSRISPHARQQVKYYPAKHMRIYQPKPRAHPLRDAAHPSPHVVSLSVPISSTDWIQAAPIRHSDTKVNHTTHASAPSESSPPPQQTDTHRHTNRDKHVLSNPPLDPPRLLYLYTSVPPHT